VKKKLISSSSSSERILLNSLRALLGITALASGEFSGISAEIYDILNISIATISSISFFISSFSPVSIGFVVSVATEKIVCFIISFNFLAVILYLCTVSVNSETVGNSSPCCPEILSRERPLLQTALSLSSTSIKTVSPDSFFITSEKSFALSAILPLCSTSAGTAAVSIQISLSFPVRNNPAPSSALSNMHSSMGFVVRADTARTANANTS
jgi:hypothetical protein